MSANEICIVLTATPFILLIWDICKSRYKKRKLKKQIHVVNPPAKKYKLRDINNVDLTQGYVQACWDELNKKK